jgi:hypothetical protein
VVKKLALVIVIVVTLAGVGWVVGGKRILSSGKLNVEAWCSRQLLAIANDHLNPTLHFDTLVYTFPQTVTLTQVSLAENNVVVISADSITIEFAGIPKAGEPLVFQSVEFQSPMVRLIKQADGTLLGITDLAKSDGGGSVKEDGGSTRLSDVLRIKKISVVSGGVSYEPPARPKMVLHPLTFELDRAQSAATDESGWYAFKASLTLDPVAELETTARLNLDNGDLELSPLTLDMSLTKPNYQVFTPEIQQFLVDNEIVGTLHGSMNGLIGLDNMSKTSLSFHVNLTDARTVIKGREIPIETLDLDGTYSQDVLDFPKITAKAFHGQMELSGRFDYSQPGSPFEASLDGKDLKLEDAMHYEGRPSSDYTGDVTIKVTASGMMDDLAGTLTGEGTTEVVNGRIVLVDMFRSKLKEKGDRQQTDRADVTFELKGDRIYFSKAVILGGLVGIRGTGDLYYDGRLNFLVNTGAVERLTGPLSAIVQGFAGSFVKYQVTGTMDDVEIGVLPFGLGAKKPDPGG